MTTHPAVGVDDDLAAGEPGVALRSANDEPAGRVDVHRHLLLRAELIGDRRLDHLFSNLAAQLRRGDRVGVLRRENDGVDVHRHVVLVQHRHLRLAIGTKPLESLRSPHIGELLRDAVREHDRKRHQLVRLVGRVTEHHPLVAGATGVDAHRDVGRLRADAVDDRAGVEVVAIARVGVADALDRPAHDARDVDVRLGRDLTGYAGETGRDERFAGDTGRRIVGEDSVQDRVGDLIGDLVGVSFGDGLGREQATDGHRDPRVLEKEGSRAAKLAAAAVSR